MIENCKNWSKSFCHDQSRMAVPEPGRPHFAKVTQCHQSNPKIVFHGFKTRFIHHNFIGFNFHFCLLYSDTAIAWSNSTFCSSVDPCRQICRTTFGHRVTKSFGNQTGYSGPSTQNCKDSHWLLGDELLLRLTGPEYPE